jgi:putative metallopeptidase DUF4344
MSESLQARRIGKFVRLALEEVGADYVDVERRKGAARCGVTVCGRRPMGRPFHICGQRCSTRVRCRIVNRMRGRRLTSAIEDLARLVDRVIGPQHTLDTLVVLRSLLDLVQIFGSAEDAADNFAKYIILQFGKNHARRLIVGAAWAWRAYLLAAFASDHGLPQERYYNLLCLAIGAQREVFADLEVYLPTPRSPHCVFEYQRLVPCL